MKFGFDWSSDFRGEDVWKVWTDGRPDDGRRMPDHGYTISSPWWVWTLRWAKKTEDQTSWQTYSKVLIFCRPLFWMFWKWQYASWQCSIASLTPYSTPFCYFQVFNNDTIYALPSHYLSGADISEINVSSKDTDPHVHESHSTTSELEQSSEDNVVPREGMYSKCKLEVPEKKQNKWWFLKSVTKW